jgi:hypothetical protein
MTPAGAEADRATRDIACMVAREILCVHGFMVAREIKIMPPVSS